MIYQITDDDLERFETLDPDDVGRLYIIVCDCIQFVESEEQGQELLIYLN